jgi:hypothetical protein
MPACGREPAVGTTGSSVCHLYRIQPVDVIVAIGDKTVPQALHGTMQVPVGFPAAPEPTD